MIYRTLLAAIAALVIAVPAVADDTTTGTTTTDTSMTTGDNTGTTGTTESQGETTKKINLNTATARDLMKVKGINAARARAVIAYRKKNGDFKAVQDIANVKGFKKLKQQTLENITNQLTIEN